MSEKYEDRFERIERTLDRIAANAVKQQGDIAALTAQGDKNGRDIAASTANVDRLTAQGDKNGRDIAALTANVDRLTVNVDKNSGDIAAVAARVDRLTANMENHSGDITALFTVVNRFEESHKQILTSQVLMADLIAKMEKRQDRIEGHVESISANVDQIAVHLRAITIKHGETEDKLNALIHMFDEWIKEHGGKRDGEAPKGG